MVFSVWNCNFTPGLLGQLFSVPPLDQIASNMLASENFRLQMIYLFGQRIPPWCWATWTSQWWANPSSEPLQKRTDNMGLMLMEHEKQLRHTSVSSEANHFRVKQQNSSVSVRGSAEQLPKHTLTAEVTDSRKEPSSCPIPAGWNTCWLSSFFSTSTVYATNLHSVQLLSH